MVDIIKPMESEFEAMKEYFGGAIPGDEGRRYDQYIQIREDFETEDLKDLINRLAKIHKAREKLYQ